MSSVLIGLRVQPVYLCALAPDFKGTKKDPVNQRRIHGALRPGFTPAFSRDTLKAVSPRPSRPEPIKGLSGSQLVFFALVIGFYPRVHDLAPEGRDAGQQE